MAPVSRRRGPRGPAAPLHCTAHPIAPRRSMSGRPPAPLVACRCRRSPRYLHSVLLSVGMYSPAWWNQLFSGSVDLQGRGPSFAGSPRYPLCPAAPAKQQATNSGAPPHLAPRLYDSHKHVSTTGTHQRYTSSPSPAPSVTISAWSSRTASGDTTTGFSQPVRSSLAPKRVLTRGSTRPVSAGRRGGGGRGAPAALG